ncbi:MAG: tRNA pseudouridine(55) synthase TruB [Gammaproteobacteria bacterium]|nr:tRNA pseudouridine(55) synthase TruB [Gammaproteobacteria bacterium]
MARRSRGRDVHGVLPLDKPVGMTSNEALQVVKHLFQARKAGHTGSLDRTATGLLPLCFGEATKFSALLLEADKRYRARCKLGVRTATGDSAGAILETRPAPAMDPAAMESVLDRFRGEIEQVPPMHSALKHQGQRLYELAYQGLEVERKPRPVSIYELNLLELEADEFEIAVWCSKGTYIRTLAEDIGAAAGCGAHVISLRRTAAGPFREQEAVPLAAVRAAAEQGSAELDRLLLGTDSIMRDAPALVLQEAVAFYLRQGQPVLVPRSPTEGRVRLYNEAGQFIGAGEVLDDGRIAPRRLFRLRPADVAAATG